MPNGGALKLTIGEYLTPSHGQVLPGAGIQPDVPCTSTNGGTNDVCVARAAGMARRIASRARPPMMMAKSVPAQRPRLAPTLAVSRMLRV